MSIGERLRSERENLGLSQPKFAAIADTTKQTLFSWETGKTAPDGFQLSALAAAGADVLYIVTGQRNQSASATPLITDHDRLAFAIETIEAGLAETKRHLPPNKKAELVMAAYDLMSQPGVTRENIIRLVRLAA
jgi:transcriptional regulator with XRE-family HTH domain